MTRLGGTLDAELPNAEHQLPTTTCMIILNVMQHMLTSLRSGIPVVDICQVCRFKAHPETKIIANGKIRDHTTPWRNSTACVIAGPDVNHFALLPPRAASFGLFAPSSPHGESAAAYYT